MKMPNNPYFERVKADLEEVLIQASLAVQKIEIPTDETLEDSIHDLCILGYLMDKSGGIMEALMLAYKRSVPPSQSRNPIVLHFSSLTDDVDKQDN